MENSIKKSDGFEIPKRNRSLDLKSLYESRFSEVRDNKKKVSDKNDEEGVKKKKRKSRKAVPLSCFESDAKKSRKENVNGVKSELGSGQKSNDKSERLPGISLALGNNENSFNIPKRPRGSVGRKKVESDLASDPSRLPNSADSVGACKSEVTKSEDQVAPSDRLVQVVTLSSGNDGNDCVSNLKIVGKAHGSNSKLKEKFDSKSTVNSSGSNVKLKQKVGADETKENRVGCSGSLVKANNQVVNKEDASHGKQQKSNRKKKDLVVGGDGDGASGKKSEHSVGSLSDRLFIDFVDDDDDDEENLEQNAARMLSSRFDPSCTVFSPKRKLSSSQKADGLSLPVSSPQDSSSQHSKSFGGGQSVSADDKGRTLRPRRESKGEGLSRKRRHFYEIHAQDLDPYWVFNRRIKIFWPLDESWYYGLVNDYNSESKRHHIKYDDREEEWVNLEEEKFKLLLFPGEVPDKPRSRKRSTRDKVLHRELTVPSVDEDSCIGDPLDSEPIASWLASQSPRVKALPKSLKRRRTSLKHIPLVSSLSSEKTDNSNSDVVDSKITKNNPDCEFASADSLLVCGTGNNLLLRTTHPSQSDKHMVYVRKKYRMTSEGSSSVCRDVKACGGSPYTVTPFTPISVILPPTKGGNFSFGSSDSDMQLWSLDDKGKLRINKVLLEYEEYRFRICLPVLRLLEFSCEIGIPWLLHDIFMLQHGAMMTTSPTVILEMLLVDSNFGLRFLLFKGCLKQVLPFVLEILIVCSQSDEQWNGNIKLLVTSIGFQLYSSEDPKKKHVFAFCSFSQLESSKWLYLDSKIQQHCLLIKQLSVSECTYDNMKELECGIFRECKPLVGLKLSSNKDALCSPESPENGGQSDAECTQFEPSSVSVQNGTAENEVRELDTEASAFSGLSSYQQDLGMDAVLASNAAENTDSSLKIQEGYPVNDRSAGCRKGSIKTDSKVIAQSYQCEPKKEVCQQIVVSAPSSVPTSNTSRTSNPRSDSTSGGLIIELPSSEQVDVPFDGKDFIPRPTSDVSWNVHDGFVRKPNPINVRNSWQHGGVSSIYSPLGNQSPAWPDGMSNFSPNGFSNGPKKPRTQVQYTLPSVGYDLSEKQKMQSSRFLPCKRIRRASLKKISDGSADNQKNMDLLTCVANVLVTHGDKGWREYGAHIVLEVANHNEWILAVKLCGVTKYSCKVKHVLQPGSTNRYSHAMMWKGGKDWVLEFTDRSQWMLFKEMHEDCYDRNIRAASVKNIPIPGVRLVEESSDCGNNAPFVRSPMKYFRQVQTDVEMAMDPSHILYDMNSDDEQWLMAHNNRTNKHKREVVSEEFLEKAMDMFEKVSYSHLRDNFADNEIEGLVTGIGSLEAAKVVYEHWREKREKMGMPLIRHLQPPLWERYQQQLKEWEHNVAHGNYAFSAGSREKVPPEKPPMFAFCMKPRGLEVPNKGSKQRSHRKLPVSGHHHISSVDQDGLVLGRRSNGHVFGDKVLYTSSIYHDFSESRRGSTRIFSSRDEHISLSIGVSEWKGNPKVYKNKSKKLGSHPSFHSRQRDYFSQRPHRQGVEQLDSSDLHEFRLRDASSAAQHALNMAKLKREKAQRFLHRADLAVHKAVVALMTAEAVKDSYGSSNGVN